jgi:phosphate transport system permease protein
MLYGTAVVSLVALTLAAPVGIGTAIFASEICTRRVRLAIKLLVEILAGVPSVVYGLLGVLFLRDWLYVLFEKLGIDALSGDTLLTAGILLAVMILPTVATLTDDALQSVPSRVREASRGLGLTRAESTLFVILPQALPSIAGALLLGLGRALGETIAVFLVVGRADNLLPESLTSWRPLVDAGQTITSKLGGAETNIAVGDPLHSSAIVALAAILFGSVLAVTIAAEALRARAAKVVGG